MSTKNQLGKYQVGQTVVISVYGKPVEVKVTEVNFTYYVGVDATGKEWSFANESDV